MTVRETLAAIYSRGGLPDRKNYLNLLERTITVLEHEDPSMRPPDASGLSGGLIRLRPDVPTLILPDLHARSGFFMSVMEACLVGGHTVVESLEAGELQVLCLGDGFHSEKRGQQRWLDAFAEYAHEYKKHKAMDAEMRESLTLMEMIMQCKCAFRGNFHFLKGNHENILNEEGAGNHPFRKFSHEGEMVKSWVLKFYDTEFLHTFALFEKSLPLFAVGSGFLASHAEPYTFYGESDLIETRSRPDVILGLTWTDNDASEEGSVGRMLAHYLPNAESAVYFGGHRPVSGHYRLRAENKYIQIHNPEKNNTALVPADRPFDPETDIRELEKGAGCV